MLFVVVLKMESNYEKLNIYKKADVLADEIWDIVMEWNNFAKNAFGLQLVHSVDSISANIAEGSGRGSYKDNSKFIRIARGSCLETKHWLKKAHKRKLLDEKSYNNLIAEIDNLIPQINSYHKYLQEKV